MGECVWGEYSRKRYSSKVERVERLSHILVIEPDPYRHRCKIKIGLIRECWKCNFWFYEGEDLR